MRRHFHRCHFIRHRRNVWFDRTAHGACQLSLLHIPFEAIGANLQQRRRHHSIRISPQFIAHEHEYRQLTSHPHHINNTRTRTHCALSCWNSQMQTRFVHSNILCKRIKPHKLHRVHYHLNLCCKTKPFALCLLLAVATTAFAFVSTINAVYTAFVVIIVVVSKLIYLMRKMGAIHRSNVCISHLLYE